MVSHVYRRSHTLQASSRNFEYQFCASIRCLLVLMVLEYVRIVVVVVVVGLTLLLSAYMIKCKCLVCVERDFLILLPKAWCAAVEQVGVEGGSPSLSHPQL